MENNNHVNAAPISIGFGFLSYFIPIAGIILYFIWREDNTKSSVKNRTLVPALVSIGINIVIYIIYMILIAALFTSTTMY